MPTKGRNGRPEHWREVGSALARLAGSPLKGDFPRRPPKGVREWRLTLDSPTPAAIQATTKVHVYAKAFLEKSQVAVISEDGTPLGILPRRERKEVLERLEEGTAIQGQVAKKETRGDRQTVVIRLWETQTGGLPGKPKKRGGPRGAKKNDTD